MNKPGRKSNLQEVNFIEGVGRIQGEKIKLFSGRAGCPLFLTLLLLFQTVLFAVAVETANPVFTNSLGRTAFQGSLRLRYDITEFDRADGESDRERIRLRARLGLIHEFSEPFALGARLSTGSQEPTSSQIDFGNDWEGFEFKLDQAYLHYTPKPAMKFWVGQIPNPILEANLIWDKDVNPQGLGEQFFWNVSKETKVFVNAGQFFLDHFWDDTDPKVFIGQAGAEWKSETGLNLRGALAYYDYVRVQSEKVPFQRRTNSRQPDGALRYDYNILALFGELDYDATVPPFGSTPLRLTLEASRNVAVSRAGTGFKADVRLGKTKRRGDFSVIYSFELLERDATLDSLSESSWHAQRVNFSGHRLSGRYYLFNQCYINLSLRFMRAIDGPKDNQRQLNLDLAWEY